MNYIHNIGTALTDGQKHVLGSFMKEHPDFSVAKILRIALFEHIDSLSAQVPDVSPFNTAEEAIKYYSPECTVYRDYDTCADVSPDYYNPDSIPAHLLQAVPDQVRYDAEEMTLKIYLDSVKY